MNTQRELSNAPLPMKRIILCADDYAQSAAISQGIVQLVEQRRLSAVSCFSESEYWSQSDNRLLDYCEHIDIGLHFNLTHPFEKAAIAAQPLNRVMGLALSARIDKVQIATALHTQLDRFESVLKHRPDFVDGHQHVHVLPGIRNVVVNELIQRYGKNLPYLRAVNPRVTMHGDFIKALVLKLLGSGFRHLAQCHHMKTNIGFGGIYSLQPEAGFAALMEQWLTSANNGDLFMCHPGAAASDISDPIGAARARELAFLQSDAFGALLSRNSICLSRFNDIKY